MERSPYSTPTLSPMHILQGLRKFNSFEYEVPLLSMLKNYGQQGLKVPIRGAEVGELLRNYKCLADLLPNSSTPAICEPLSSIRSPLNHRRLKKFVTEEFDLKSLGIPHGLRVAILLPNGPELALSIIALASHWCAAPINPANTTQEIKAELISTRVVAAIVSPDFPANDAFLKVASELGIGVFSILPSGEFQHLSSYSVISVYVSFASMIAID